MGELNDKVSKGDITTFKRKASDAVGNRVALGTTVVQVAAAVE